MEFSSCFEILSSRAPHTHAHCDEEQQKQAQLAAEQAAADARAVSAAQSDLEQMTAAELLRHFFLQQEQRVKIYREFQQGFQEHKATAHFQEFCTAITKRFAKASEQVNAVERLLQQREQQHTAKLIRNVQENEKEKLLLTSALFVELMRLDDQEQSAEPDATISSLLEQSVATLKEKNAAIVERINDTLEEIRETLTELCETE